MWLSNTKDARDQPPAADPKDSWPTMRPCCRVSGTEWASHSGQIARFWDFSPGIAKMGARHVSPNVPQMGTNRPCPCAASTLARGRPHLSFVYRLIHSHHLPFESSIRWPSNCATHPSLLRRPPLDESWLDPHMEALPIEAQLAAPFTAKMC